MSPGPVYPDATGGSAPSTAMPGTTANTAGTASSLYDATSLSSTYQMTKADLGVKLNWDGQERTIGDIIQMFENLPPNQVAVWEQSLVSAGLQAPTTVGDPQARTDAFNSLLRFVAYDQQTNPTLNPMAVLDQLQAENPGSNTGTRSLAAVKSAAAGVRIHVDLSNPLDVKQLGDAVAQKLVGRDLTPAEAVAITNTIRSQQTASAQGELSSQQSLMESQAAANLAAATGQQVAPGAGSGLVTTMAPTSAEAATTQYLTQNDSADVQAHALLNVFQAIKQKVETDAQGTGPRAATGPMKVV